MKAREKAAIVIGISLFSNLLPYSLNALSYWDVGPSLGLGTADLQNTIINILKWLLGLLGLIGVSMMLYGGFTWLTSAGNEEKISKAKKVISAAVIGLIVIMLSWALVQYALNTLFNVSGTS